MGSERGIWCARLPSSFFRLSNRAHTTPSGELGLGPEEPKSATKPTEHKPLKGIDVISYVLFSALRIGTNFFDLFSIYRIAASQNTTLFLARPTGEKFSELPRHPEEVEAPETCLKCNGEDGELLECEKVAGISKYPNLCTLY